MTFEAMRALRGAVLAAMTSASAEATGSHAELDRRRKSVKTQQGNVDEN